MRATHAQFSCLTKIALGAMVPLGAEANLILFQADIYNDNEFEPAIDGCESVFHVATPIHHGLESSQVGMNFFFRILSLFWWGGYCLAPNY